MFKCNGKTWLSLNCEYLSYEELYLILLYLFMKEYYEIYEGEIIDLNDEKMNENTLFYV